MKPEDDIPGYSNATNPVVEEEGVAPVLGIAAHHKALLRRITLHCYAELTAAPTAGAASDYRTAIDLVPQDVSPELIPSKSFYKVLASLEQEVLLKHNLDWILSKCETTINL